MLIVCGVEDRHFPICRLAGSTEKPLHRRVDPIHWCFAQWTTQDIYHFLIELGESHPSSQPFVISQYDNPWDTMAQL